MHLATAFASAGALVLAICFAQPATAQNRKGRVELRAGVAGVIFEEKIKVRLADDDLPNAGLKVKDNVTAIVELDYFIRNDWSLALTTGAPPTTHSDGRGSLRSAGRLGQATYGPVAFVLRRHFDLGRSIRPYVGAGPIYAFIFDSDDGLLVKGLDVKGRFGGTVVVGVDLPVSELLGVFLDAKQLFLTVPSRFDFEAPGAAAPGSARIRLNPLVLSAGLSVRL